MINFSFICFLIGILGPVSGRDALLPEQLPEPSVHLSLGHLTGVSKHIHGQRISVFLGVPYAKPPINSLRFQKTQSIDQFPQNPYPANYLRPHCVQPPNAKYGNDAQFSEDCLHMNIFVPQTELNAQAHNQLDCNGQSFPVLFYIFGGVSSYNQPIKYNHPGSQAFNLSFNGEMLASRNRVITVVANYRVEIFGHMYLPGQLPGNQALYDQQEAIRFVHNHIDQFCGNPNRITLVGNSYGSMSIGMHLLSGKVDPYFRSVIMQSGSPLFRVNMPYTVDQYHRNSLLQAHNVHCLRSNRTDGHLSSDDFQVIDKLKQQASLEAADAEIFPVNFLENERIQRKMRHLLNPIRTVLEKFGAKLDSKQLNAFKQNLIDNVVDELQETVDQELDRQNSLINEAKRRFKVDIQCLLGTSASNMNQAASGLYQFYFLDGDIIPLQSILEHQLRNHIKITDGSIKSMLIGVNDDENCYFSLNLANTKNATPSYYPSFSKHEMYEYFDQNILIRPFWQIKSEIKSLYIDQAHRWKYQRGLLDSWSSFRNDVDFYCPALFFSLELMAPDTRIYNYMMQHKSDKHFASKMQSLPNINASWLGSCHADDLLYLFDSPHLYADQFAADDLRFADQFLSVWTHFLYHGHPPGLSPGQPWPQSTFEHVHFVSITKDRIANTPWPFLDRCRHFWSKYIGSYQV